MGRKARLRVSDDEARAGCMWLVVGAIVCAFCVVHGLHVVGLLP